MSHWHSSNWLNFSFFSFKYVLTFQLFSIRFANAKWDVLFNIYFAFRFRVHYVWIYTFMPHKYWWISMHWSFNGVSIEFIHRLVLMSFHFSFSFDHIVPISFSYCLFWFRHVPKPFKKDQQIESSVHRKYMANILLTFLFIRMPFLRLHKIYCNVFEFLSLFPLVCNFKRFEMVLWVDHTAVTHRLGQNASLCVCVP